MTSLLYLMPSNPIYYLSIITEYIFKPPTVMGNVCALNEAHWFARLLSWFLLLFQKVPETSCHVLTWLHLIRQKTINYWHMCDRNAKSSPSRLDRFQKGSFCLVTEEIYSTLQILSYKIHLSIPKVTKKIKRKF